MATVSINAPGLSGGLLYNNGSNNARVCITSETGEFDMDTIKNWQDEGFDVVYLPLDGGGKEYESRLKAVKEGLGVGENYAVIAYGDAANYCLDYYLKSQNASRLCALVAYYPSVIPDTRSQFPLSLPVLVHLAGDSVDVTTIPVALGLQGKKRRKTRPLNPGIGTGERLELAYPAYTYGNAQPGFAEHDMEEYDHLAADLAWTRTIQVLRKGFSRQADLERRWEEHQEGKYFKGNITKTMDAYISHKKPAVTYVPTMSGAIGTQALRRFYENHFLGKLPPSMHIRLLSRTSGADRVVDELYVSFEHSQEIPWMLPGVPPTNKRVEIIVVSIVSLRAGRLYSEHTYWDQASVLVQVGLLDPKLVPQGVEGVDRLPILGREAARRILHEDPENEQVVYHNRMIRRARALRSRSSRASQAGEESAADLKSEAETPMPIRETKKGKQVQENENPQPEPAKAHNGTAVESKESNGHEEDDDGAVTETESTTKAKSEPANHKAFVEEGSDENEE
ncbi:dienelactone hydrolase [Penicillium brasilianum]|uniref:Dienelactone hydrolase n=1 Tax=Penicillium brasilianum TaxID=104259 RepID=A0A1S9RE11_PENBI|nr:dienelactone hydrolase [Penicillium brasilianum]